MLVDIPNLGPRDLGLAMILGIVSGGPAGAVRLTKGCYQIGHFSFDHILPWRIDFLDEACPEIGEYQAGTYVPSYGVCDGLEQFLKKFGQILEEDPRKLVVSFTQVRRDDQSPDGGWRWHKWGEYVGEKTPTCEYLYDEKDIDAVWVFHIYDLTRRM